MFINITKKQKYYYFQIVTHIKKTIRVYALQGYSFFNYKKKYHIIVKPMHSTIHIP